MKSSTKDSRANVSPDLKEATMERQGMKRRDFLLMAGSAVIAVPLVAALGGCGDGSSGTAASAGDFTITSSTSNLHTHAITIKAADLTAGVQVVYTTTNTSGHTHTVVITPAQFNDINAGNTDNITSSVDLTHSHDFPVKKPV